MTDNRREVPKAAWIRRADQAVVASLLFSGLVAMGVYWLLHGGWRGGLIEIERAPPVQVQFQVDVNRAQWSELAQLPDVGETLAKRIIESRTQDGRFVDQDDLLRVRGIGPKTLERIRPYLLPMPPEEAVAGQ